MRLTLDSKGTMWHVTDSFVMSAVTRTDLEIYYYHFQIFREICRIFAIEILCPKFQCFKSHIPGKQIMLLSYSYFFKIRLEKPSYLMTW